MARMTGLEPVAFRLLRPDALPGELHAHMLTIACWRLLEAPLSGVGLSSSGDDDHGETVETEMRNVKSLAQVSSRCYSARMNDDVITAFISELEKIAAAWGKNVGKSYGRSSSKGGFSTKMRSAGMGSAKPSRMPQLSGTKPIKGVGGLKPPLTGERNNQVTLRRGLSNIETPS